MKFRKRKTTPVVFDPGVIHACENCGHRNAGAYCSACGQSFREINRPFREVIKDFLGFFSFDTSIFRTIRPFLLKPGFLAREFLNGRRKRYMSPIRLYLFLSIVFFFLARTASLSDRQQDNIKFALDPQASSAVSRGDTVTENDYVPGLTLNDKQHSESILTDTALSNLLRNDSLFYGNPADSLIRDSATVARSEKFRNSLIRAADNPDLYVSTLLKNISYALFLLMPLFALILQLLYIRRKRYYMEHLIFSVNMHSFALLILTLMVAMQLILPGNNAYLAYFLLIIPLYFIVGMKRFYRQGIFKVILKAMILGLIYSILLSATMVGLVILTIMRL